MAKRKKGPRPEPHVRRQALVTRLERAERRDLEKALESAERKPARDVEQVVERLEIYGALRERLGAGRRAEQLWGAAILLLCVGAVGIAWSWRLGSPEIELDADATMIRLWEIDSLSWRGRLELSRGEDQVFSGFSELRLNGGSVSPPGRVAVRGQTALESLRIAGDGPVTLRSVAPGCLMITGAAAIRAVMSIEASVQLAVDTPTGRWSPQVTEESQLQLLRASGAAHQAELSLCFQHPWRLAGTAPRRVQIAEPYPLDPGKEFFVPSLRSGTVTLRATGKDVTLSDRDKLELRAARGTAAPEASAVLEIDGSLRLIYQGRVGEVALVHGRYEEDLSPTWIEYLRTHRL